MGHGARRMWQCSCDQLLLGVTHTTSCQVEDYLAGAVGVERLRVMSTAMVTPPRNTCVRVNTLRITTQAGGGAAPHCTAWPWGTPHQERVGGVRSRLGARFMLGAISPHASCVQPTAPPCMLHACSPSAPPPPPPRATCAGGAGAASGPGRATAACHLHACSRAPMCAHGNHAAWKRAAAS